jgi:hypothetical protein
VTRPARAYPREAASDFCRAGLPVGTVVLTWAGALPVAFPGAGDRIVTCARMHEFRRIETPKPLEYEL